jgi:hypothetical protein
MHPKYLLSESQENFQIIFQMLELSEASLLEPVWSLISKLPENRDVIDGFNTLDFVRRCQTPELRQQAWVSLLNPAATFKQLYCIEIINNKFMSAKLPKTSENMDPAEEEIHEEQMRLWESQVAWKSDFITLGGFSHLINCLTHINLPEIKSMLEIRTIKSLMKAIYSLIFGHN